MPENVTITQNEQILSPEQQRLLGLAIPFAENYAASPPQVFPGDRVVPKTQLEIDAEQPQLGTGQAQAGFGGNVLQAHNTMLDPTLLDPSRNPYFQAATQAAINPLISAYQTQIMPSIRHGAGQTGNVGSSRQGIAEGQAAKGIMGQIADTTARMSLAQQQMGLDAMGKGVALAPSTTSGVLPVGANTLSNVAGQDRNLRQSILTDNVRKFMEQYNLPIETAQQIMQVLGGVPGQSSSSTVTGPDTSPTLGQNILGGAAAGASIGGQFGSPWLGAGLGGLTGWLFGD